MAEARIFMKFETYSHKIVIDYQPNFHKDPFKACPSSVVTLLFGHRGVPKMLRNNCFGGPILNFLENSQNR